MKFKANLAPIVIQLLTCSLLISRLEITCSSVSVNKQGNVASNGVQNSTEPAKVCGNSNSTKACVDDIKDETTASSKAENVEKSADVTTASWFSRGNISSFHYLNLPGSNKGINDLTSPCKRPARCEPLVMNVSTCFGAPLSHRLTSVNLVGRNFTQYQIQRELLKWQSSLRNIPKCWGMVQTLLCGVYIPRCENGMVDLPSQDMCRAIRGPCRVVEQTIGWPSFLRCDAEGNFPTHCKAEPRELRFNTAGKCPPHLVPTDISRSWYEGWDGCGLQCHNPLFTDSERSDVQTMIRVVGTCCLLCSLFTVLTFFIDWRSANKYPALIIFYMNGCFMIITIGWMAQFTTGARDDIVCRKDGILRKSEPSSGENLACVIVFVLIYYFVMAASVWFVILAYSWYMSFKALGKIRDAIDAKAAYFHLVAWSLPLVLTIAILALAEVDGDSVNGICFVGYENVFVRVGFVLIPILACISVGVFFLIKGLIVLVKLKLGSDDIISVKASSKIRETIARLVAFTIVVLIFILTTFACHVYEYSNRSGWAASLQRYIMCKSNLTFSHFEDDLSRDHTKNCQLESRPSVTAIQLQLLTLFGAGIIMSTWIWTPSTVETWRRFFRRTFRQSSNEPVKLTKHKMIAKAFAKRKEINGGRMSFSFQSTHDDPLGMNFDLHSAASPEISSNWHAVLPKFIARRGAFDDGKAGRRNSSASDLSHQKTESQGTRRHSLDSQISFHMSEQERRQYLANARQQRRKRKKEIKRKSRNARVVPVLGVANLNPPRRGSDTSQHSDFGHLIPHHLLPAKIDNIDQAASVVNHIVERPNIGISRMSFRIPNPFNSDKETSNLTVEEASTHLPVLVNDDNTVLVDIMMPSLNGDDSAYRETDSMSENDNTQQLGGDLTNCLLSRAIVGSRSDIEMKSLCSNHSHRKAQPDTESTVVDMDMDNDNRDSLSS